MTSLPKTQHRNRSPILPMDAVADVAEGRPPAIRESVMSFCVSVVLHSMLLLIMAVFVFSQESLPEKIEILEAELKPEPEPVSLSVPEVPLDNLLADAEKSDAAKIKPAIRALANASDPPPVIVEWSADRGVLPADVTGSGNGWGGTAIAGLGATAGALRTAGNGVQETGGDGEIGFFGTKAKGKSFVFIVDCSGSMRRKTETLHPRLNVALSRFARARQELYSSLAQLNRGQTFYVIFYNSETFPLFYPQTAQYLLPNNPGNMGLAKTWIEKIVPGGGTEPQDAFRLALSLRPEVIFFLTDGAIPGGTRLVAKKNNKSRTRIHTIAFGIDKHQEILKNIAKDNQGRFRYVP